MTSQELSPPQEISHLTESARYRLQASVSVHDDIYPHFCPSATHIPLPPLTQSLGASPEHNHDVISQPKNHYYVNITHVPISPSWNTETTRESSGTDWEDNSSSSVDSVANETNRYNRLKLVGRPVGGGQRGGVSVAVGGRNKKMHCRTTRTDSESSSASILSESGGIPDAKQREIEHYNRLKLNLDRIPQNKKALRGLRVLNKIPSFVYRHQNSEQPTPQGRSSVAGRSSRHSDKRRTTEEPKQKLQRQVSSKTSRYKNESHVNKLHSVSGQPLRTMSFSWGSRPRSSSTGDMSGAVRQECGEHLDGASDERQHTRRTARSRSFNDIHGKTRSSRNSRPRRITRHDFHGPDTPPASTPSASPSTSRRQRNKSGFSEKATPSQHHHKTHRSSSEGNLRVLHQKVRASESFTAGMHTSTETGRPLQSPIPVSPLHSVSYTQVEPLSPPSPPSPVHGVPFIDPIVSIKCDSEGGEYRSDIHDFRLSIPKGAVKKRVDIQIGFALRGPFKFPGDLRPVSPIVWLCSTPETKLRKPVEIMLPHYLDTSVTALSKVPNSASRYSVQFVKASHTTSAASGSESGLSKIGGGAVQVRY